MSETDKILVVDDEIVIRELMTEVLLEEGYAVKAVESAMAALEVLKNDGDYVLLFTDIMMPEMDGIELIREAKKIKRELIPIVMTGFATLETARAAVKEGAYDYVLKPFSISEIKLSVTNALERYHLLNENARLREINNLFDISDKIASIRDENELLDYVLHTAVERIGADCGSLILRTPDDSSFDVKASVSLPENESNYLMEMGVDISEWVVKNLKPLHIDNTDDCPEMAYIDFKLDGSSLISVPLECKSMMDHAAETESTTHSKVLAVLNVHRKKNGKYFSHSDLKTLIILANHAAIALDNVRLIRSIEDAHLSTLKSMALILEAKDAYTHGHSERVRDYSMIVAQNLGLSDREIETLRTGAALHDIGKVGVNDAILNKTGRPTEEEWQLIRRHPEIGFSVLEHVRVVSPSHLQLVRSHHERVDGKGYPDGLRADELPVIVRIITIADAYDAMSSNRAYRIAMKTDAIINEIEKGSGTQFDPEICHLFVELLKSGELDHHDV